MHRCRSLLGVVLAALAVLTLTSVPQPVTAAPPDKLQADARKALAGGRRADLVVELTERADLTPVRHLKTHAQRTAAGRARLIDVATRSQRGLRDLLRRNGTSYRSFWIVNALHVKDADAKLAARIAARPEVRTVRTVRRYALPQPRAVEPLATVNGVEWNVARIGADRVWAEYGTRGEGIVIANIDTGVKYDHPALVGQYRGNLGNGAFDHNYNWFDPYGQCTEPCDVNGHGTHTMGTMVGDDGGTNRVGVAPGARWIAARGCAGTGCDELALLLAGEWVIAPLDANMENPRPDLAPHIVNNSWGASLSDPFYADVVRRWTEVGIMPVFAAGNDGPECGTVGSPADYSNSYAVAAFDSANAVASFSSRGQTGATETKPDISAPGVAIRSALNNNGYAVWEGTSMAAPHVAGAVALLWSLAPELIGDVAATRQLLGDSAIDVADASCGGTTDDNAVWGEGRLDVYAAASRAPIGSRGTLTGLVRSPDGTAVVGAQIHLAGANRVERVTTTDVDGRYTMIVPPADYTLTATAFGYHTLSTTTTVTQDTTTTTNVTLTVAPRHSITGTIRESSGVGAANVPVRLLATPLPAVTTDAAGSYRIDNVPEGTYTVATSAARCVEAARRDITVDGAETVDFEPPARLDSHGYQCRRELTPYVEGTTTLPLTGDDASTAVTLPFPVPFYGAKYQVAWVATNGFLTFDRAADNSINREVPNGSYPNAAIFALWDDLVVDSAASVRTATLGTAPNRRFVVEWKNVTFYYGPGQRATFALEITESGGIIVHYGDLTGGSAALGASASIGIENIGGSVGLEYSRDTASLTANTALAFRASGAIAGTVTEPDGDPAAGALVTMKRGDAPDLTATTTSDGSYVLQVPLGTYTLEVSQPTFALYRATVVLDTDGATVRHDVQLSLNERVVSGVVRDDLGAPVEGARVQLRQITDGYEAVFARTGPDGRYRFEKVPETRYNSTVTAFVPQCLRDGYTFIEEIVGGDVTADITVVAPRSVVDGADSYGNQCRVTTTIDPVEPTTPVAVTGSGHPPTAVALPFDFPFYGNSYSTAYVSSYGYLTFVPQEAQHASVSSLPTNGMYDPDAAVYGFWDDLVVDSTARVTSGTIGTAPNRRFAVSWRDVLINGTSARISFDIVLYENGEIAIQHRALPDDPRARGSAAAVGIENADSTDAHEYSYYAERLLSGQAIRYLPPTTVTGVITDAGTGSPLSGARVRLIRLDRTEQEVLTSSSGTYTAQVPVGTYTLEVSHTNHVPSNRTVRLDVSYGTTREDVALNLTP